MIFSKNLNFLKILKFTANVRKNTSRHQKGGPERCARVIFRSGAGKVLNLELFYENVSIFIISTENKKIPKTEI